MPLRRKVGTRHRKDMGDIAGLARSIAEFDLLHPIVATPDGTLIAGQRGIMAFQALGRTEIPVTLVASVIEFAEIVRRERAENFDRKDFTWSEAVEIARAVEVFEKAAAKERQREHGNTAPGRKKDTSGNLPQVKRAPQSRDKVAKATGKSAKALAKAEAGEVQLMPAGQIVYHGVPSPNSGKIIAFST